MQTQKQYLIRRGDSNKLSLNVVTCEVIGGIKPYWLKHMGHRSDGFEYGDNGRGSEDLAQSLLSDVLHEAGDDYKIITTLSELLRHGFKQKVISVIDRNSSEHVFEEKFIFDWVGRHVNRSMALIKDYRVSRDMVLGAAYENITVNSWKEFDKEKFERNQHVINAYSNYLGLWVQ